MLRLQPNAAQNAAQILRVGAAGAGVGLVVPHTSPGFVGAMIPVLANGADATAVCMPLPY